MLKGRKLQLSRGVGILLLFAPGAWTILRCWNTWNTPAGNSCINNLRQLDGAKEQWMYENHKATNDVPTMKEILPYIYIKGGLKCPHGGVYSLGRAGEPSRCSIDGAAE